MSDEKIVLVARLKVKPDKIEEAKAAALAIVEPSRKEEGCINYDVHQSIEDPTVFVWHETWADKAAIDEHFDKTYFIEFAQVVQRVAAEPSQITLTKMISEK